MAIRRITHGDIRLGQTLAWNVYGENGALLVRQGFVLASEAQVDNLVERGFIEDSSLDTLKEYKDPPSVLRMLNEAAQRLQAALPALAAGTNGLRGELDAIAALVGEAVATNADVAVACILHNQQAVAYEVRHCIDTAVVAQTVALALKKSPDELRTLTLAALTMNLGMLGHQQRLHGDTAPLSEADKRIVREHPQVSAVLLRRAGIEDNDWIACVLAHHENEDGSGYPLGKAGAAIPELAKLLALADRYCARVSERRYRKPMLPNQALRDILLEARSTLDAQIASVLIRELGIYPIGSYVRLLNGEVGVVARKGLNSTAPWVESVIGPRGAPLDVFLQRDTRGDLNGIRDVLSATQVGLTLRMDRIWGRAAAL
ncbi:HD-GYP domain-containing protein [Massilia sp. NR 4-1]|uniref:HD-GYP domain-containing protein n=1 Tax=Massilia sp. NR 4-1 TaxID=1678028 RepID=UPI00067BDF83|nr:HD domain-containing phosphohydrolase [Massilia sp. NR 4-1]